MPKSRDNDSNGASVTKKSSNGARRHNASNGRTWASRSRPASKGGWTNDGQSRMHAVGSHVGSGHVAGGSSFSGG